MSILNLFKSNPRPLSLAEIADSLGLIKTTVHTIVKTLEKNGFLLKDPSTRRYQLGFSLFELGTIQAASLEINQRAAAHLRPLANEAAQVCRVGIWDSDSVFITMTFEPLGANSLTRQLGPRLPGYCTALGKAILANFRQDRIADYLNRVELRSYTPHTIVDRQALMDDFEAIRQRGYSIANMEILPYQAGIGAPIRNATGEVVGAVSLRLNPEDLNSEVLDIRASRILRAAYDISIDMGWNSLSAASDTA
jgi:DNA-binding IclR family transcriptional regulator